MTRITTAQAIELALRHHELGQLDRAADIYRQVLAQHPDHPEALHLLGAAELQRGNAEQAVLFIARAAALNPTAANVQCNLGEALRQAKQYHRSEAALREAVRLDPKMAAAHDNLGLLLEETEQHGDAAASYRSAIALTPRNAQFHFHLARVMFKLDELDECVNAADAAVRIDPNHSLAITIGGTALAMGGKPVTALQWLDAALAREPNSSAAWVYRSRALAQLGRHEEAIEAHHRAIAADPSNPNMRNSLLLVLHYVAGMAGEEIADAHRAWAHAYADPITAAAPPHSNDRDPNRRLRIGYVSADFRAHAVGFFITPLLRAHDREAVEVFCYASNTKRDGTTELIRKSSDQWRDIHGVSDDEAAAIVRADGIDILVDLSGHTTGNRLELFTRRPAPVQVTYLGYPGTTGLRAIDYRLTDVQADPIGRTEHLHREKLARLPEVFLCYAPPAQAPPVAPLPFDSRGHITFGTFARPMKISGPAIETWCRIMKRVPNSRMLFKAIGMGEEQTRAHWHARFAAHGVTADRVELRDLTEHFDDYLKLVSDVDLVVDTFPYNGTTTTCESIWMGVPVVTLAGDTHVSRVGMTILHSVGLDDLVTAAPEAYVETAVALASDVPRLRDLRTHLRDRMAASPLTDGPRLARQVEASYRVMWKTWCASGT